jgi:SNF family Na+-dependent transporter
VGSGENGALLAPGQRQWLLVLLAVFVLNFVLIYRGVNKGIEALCKIAMPLMLVLGIIVLLRVLTLSPDPSKPDQSLTGGLGFMWNPHPDQLWDPKTWLAASGQIFFSLSVGFGIIINYASYLTDKDDVALSSLTSCSVNEFFEVCMGGLITIPAAFVFLGLVETREAAGSTFALGFKALPNVFALMPAGRIVGFLWFVMLFLAAITSSVSMLQPVIAFFEEGIGLKRHASAAFLGLLSAIGCGYVVYFSKDLLVLDLFDFWVGSVLIFALATIQAILYGWVFGVERGHREVHLGAHMQVPKFVQFMLKYITPVYLLAIFGLFCIYNVPGYVKAILSSPVATGSMLFIGVILAFILVLVHIAGRRWEAEGRFGKID